MKKLNSFLHENEESNAHSQAVKMGLKYRGFGLWANPATGKIEYRSDSESDTLVPVNPEEEAEGGSEGPMDPTQQPGMEAPGGPEGGMGDGEGIGEAPLPGQEQAPKLVGWYAGPDGDTMVGPESVDFGTPDDSFERKPNNFKWTAGPAGSNFTNVDTNEVVVNEATTDPAEKVWKNAADVARRKVGTKTMDAMPATDRNIGLGWRDAADKENQGSDTRKERIRNAGRDMGIDPSKLASKPNRSSGYDEYERSDDHSDRGDPDIRMDRRVAASPRQKQKDADQVKTLNDGIRKFISNPDYDLDYVGEELGAGAFGSVFRGPDGKSVIKQGEIGPEELKALHAMMDDDAFPTLINARFDSPFLDRESSANNPEDTESKARPEGQSRYFDKDEESQFGMKFPTATGRFAMTTAPGEALHNGNISDEDMPEMMKQVWRARARMHMNGISHNDMHGGNIYWDPESKKASILDLGLAKKNPMSALKEAFGGFDENDFQFDDYPKMFDFAPEILDRFNENRESVKQELEDNGYGDEEIEELFTGGVRLGDKEMADHAEWAGVDDDQIMDIVRKLYKGIGTNDLEQRMSDAYDKMTKTSPDAVKLARGQQSIVPSKNIIPDD